jgi:hypothetical protein
VEQEIRQGLGAHVLLCRSVAERSRDPLRGQLRAQRLALGSRLIAFAARIADPTLEEPALVLEADTDQIIELRLNRGIELDAASAPRSRR